MNMATPNAKEVTVYCEDNDGCGNMNMFTQNAKEVTVYCSYDGCHKMNIFTPNAKEFFLTARVSSACDVSIFCGYANNVTIDCSGSNSCDALSDLCPAASKTVVCGGMGSCESLTTDGRSANTFLLECTGEASCIDAHVLCPDGDCQMFCSDLDETCNGATVSCTGSASCHLSSSGSGSNGMVYDCNDGGSCALNCTNGCSDASAPVALPMFMLCSTARSCAINCGTEGCYGLTLTVASTPFKFTGNASSTECILKDGTATNNCTLCLDDEWRCAVDGDIKCVGAIDECDGQDCSLSSLSVAQMPLDVSTDQPLAVVVPQWDSFIEITAISKDNKSLITFEGTEISEVGNATYHLESPGGCNKSCDVVVQSCTDSFARCAYTVTIYDEYCPVPCAEGCSLGSICDEDMECQQQNVTVFCPTTSEDTGNCSLSSSLYTCSEGNMLSSTECTVTCDPNNGIITTDCDCVPVPVPPQECDMPNQEQCKYSEWSEYSACTEYKPELLLERRCRTLLSGNPACCQPLQEQRECYVTEPNCPDKPCIYGKCRTSKHNKKHCECVTGFTGDYCEIDIKDCPSTDISQNCGPAYILDLKGRTVKRNIESCAYPDIIRAKKAKYDKLVFEFEKERKMKRFTTMTTITVSAVSGFLILVFIWRRRRNS